MKEMILEDINENELIYEAEFTTPIRKKVDHDWGYMMSFVSDYKQVGSGLYVIYDEFDNVIKKGKFNNQSIIESSWYSDDSKYSFLFSERFMLENGNKYKLWIKFDSLLHNDDIEVCLHYLDK